MPFITKSKLTSIVDSKTFYRSKTYLLLEARQYSRSRYSTSVFLCHSHHDSEYVENLVIFLRTLGVDAYVDWMDDEMPKETCGDTARKLKEKISNNDKFIFLATNQSLDSKWCNWEIGYGDAYKYGNQKIALFPLKEDYLSWNGLEYLQIYPYIKESDFVDGYYKVVFPDGNEVCLEDWLKK